MIQYYCGRELSEKLHVNLAKWKRWSREFLSPDPLGGFQSGYARQYTIDDAFRVFLGGHLVKDLHLSIPESKIVLKDLGQWINDNGFMSCFEQTNTGRSRPLVTEYIIGIMNNAEKVPLHYHIRGIISKEFLERNGMQIVEERYTEQWLPQDVNDIDADGACKVKNLFITRVLKDFAKKMGISPLLFRSPA